MQALWRIHDESKLALDDQGAPILDANGENVYVFKIPDIIKGTVLTEVGIRKTLGKKRLAADMPALIADLVVIEDEPVTLPSEVAELQIEALVDGVWTKQWVVRDKNQDELDKESYAFEMEKLTAIRQVKEDAEEQRLKYITPGDAKMLVYNQKALEQKNGKGKSPVNVKAEYPFIEAEMRAKGESFETVRSRIEATESAWAPIAAEIEYKTIVAVGAIDAATTKAEIDAAANVDWTF